MSTLHQLGRQLNYRTAWDESRAPREKDPQLMILPGKRGHLYVHGPGKYAFAATRRRAVRILAEVPGCQVLQDGDDGVNGTFPTDQLDQVAKLVGIRRRRQVKVTPELLERLKLARSRSGIGS